MDIFISVAVFQSSALWSIKALIAVVMMGFNLLVVEGKWLCRYQDVAAIVVVVFYLDYNCNEGFLNWPQIPLS